MKYALRTTREVATNQISVYPVFRVRETAHPYRVKYIEVGVAERLQIFDTREEALDAFKYESVAAEYHTKSQEELKDALNIAIADLQEMDLNTAWVCRRCDISIETLHAFKSGRNPYNPRTVAKICIIRDLLREMSAKIAVLLPSERRITPIKG